MRAGTSRSIVVLLTITTLLGACGTAAPSRAPATPLPTQAPASMVPSIAPPPSPSSVLPTPTPTAADPYLGRVVVTVSDKLRVRSEPRVSDDSIRYEPLLPIYSDLRVLDGPVEGSGYVWYQVEPLDFTLDDGPGYGWVAMAGTDGKPWIGPKPTTGPVPPEPTGAAFDEVLRPNDDQETATITQTASWQAPRTTGVTIRVYGLTECVARPAGPAPGTRGPCLLEGTPLTASVLRLLATAPASDGVVSWTWSEGGCSSGFETKPGGRSYEAVVLAAYGAPGHSSFAIAEPGYWYEPLPNEVVSVC